MVVVEEEPRSACGHGLITRSTRDQAKLLSIIGSMTPLASVSESAETGPSGVPRQRLSLTFHCHHFGGTSRADLTVLRPT